jgi:hypothetical protein
VTDAIRDEAPAWQARPLEVIYLVVLSGGRSQVHGLTVVAIKSEGLDQDSLSLVWFIFDYLLSHSPSYTYFVDQKIIKEWKKGSRNGHTRKPDGRAPSD